jgi:hypothetical protein
MSEPDQLEPLSIGDAFPVGNPAGDWVMVLSMAMNDLVTLDGKIHDALDNDGPEATYFLRLLCGTLRELWRLFQVADENEQVGKLIDDLVSEARVAYDQVRELFVRPEATEDDPDPYSWAEVHLKDVRDRTYHYPRVDSDELRHALAGGAGEQARRLDSGPRPFQFADVVALRISFGDINERTAALRGDHHDGEAHPGEPHSVHVERSRCSPLVPRNRPPPTRSGAEELGASAAASESG